MNPINNDHWVARRCSKTFSDPPNSALGRTDVTPEHAGKTGIGRASNHKARVRTIRTHVQIWRARHRGRSRELRHRREPFGAVRNCSTCARNARARPRVSTYIYVCILSGP